MSTQSKYSDELLEKVKHLRSVGWSWRAVSREVGFSASGLRNALLYREGPTGAQIVDKLPTQVRQWPKGVNFSPDELQLGAGT